jgi:hypothetical protein
LNSTQFWSISKDDISRKNHNNDKRRRIHEYLSFRAAVKTEAGIGDLEEPRSTPGGMGVLPKPPGRLRSEKPNPLHLFSSSSQKKQLP